MSFSLAARNTLRLATTANRAAYSTVIARGKATLPELDYDFGALEPFISGQINEVSLMPLIAPRSLQARRIPIVSN